MKNKRTFRIVFFIFIFVEMISCIVNLLTDNDTFRSSCRLGGIIVNIFACGILCFYFKKINTSISKLFKIITIAKVVETLSYSSTLIQLDSKEISETLQIILFIICVIEYILLWIVGLKMNALGNTRTVRQAGIAIVIQINIDSILVLLGFFLLPRVFEYSHKMLIMRGFFLVSAIFMIYMLYYVQKLFSPYEDELDEDELDEDFKNQQINDKYSNTDEINTEDY